MSTAHERITLNLTRKSCESLTWLATETDQTRTDVINRALQLYDYWLSEEIRGGEWQLHRGEETIKVKMI